ncbi:MAG: hypothetical protein IKF80_07670 [Erysipelotrichaceae bacterium]|nr:hypothetical protein [Erysipelotrichaceae bacterium]
MSLKPIYDNINIYGNYLSEVPVGYCFCLAHRGSLTKSNMKKHKCLAKACPFFKRNEMHAYWKQRKHLKQQAKEKRKALNSIYA